MTIQDMDKPIKIKNGKDARKEQFRKAQAYPKLIEALHDYVAMHGGSKGKDLLRELGEL